MSDYLTEFVYRCEDPELAQNLTIGRIIHFVDHSQGVDGFYRIVDAMPCACGCAVVEFTFVAERAG
jgi:hypothetical protein